MFRMYAIGTPNVCHIRRRVDVGIYKPKYYSLLLSHNILHTPIMSIIMSSDITWDWSAFFEELQVFFLSASRQYGTATER